MRSNTHAAMTQAIVDAHRSLALPTRGGLLTIYTEDTLVYRAAKQACITLGFIETDAECVATAWQKMFERSGEFNAAIWPDQAIDFGMSTSPKTDAFPICPHRLGLYAVLPDAAWVGRMAKAGVPTVQLRFKSDDVLAVKREVNAAVDAVKGTGARLFINDHWEAAIAAGAYGVHLGQEDVDEADLQAIRAASLRLGLSSHGYSEMVRADRFSPSYIAMGAIFPTTLKRMATAPQGTGRLGAYVRLMSHYPTVAIGGIDVQNLHKVLLSGAGSIAVVRALVASENPEQMAASLQAAINAAA